VRELRAEGRAVLEVVRRRAPDATRALADFSGKAAAAIAARAAEIAAPTEDDHEPPAVGDEVEVQGTSIRGELVAISGSTARLRRGALTFQAPLATLRRRRSEPPPKERFRPLRSDDNVPTELNLVGTRVREALDRLERFLDRAQSAGVDSIRIIHGLGTGALKR